MKIIVQAEPEPISVDFERTALIVVDMQNAFCTTGGMLDTLRRLDKEKARKTIETDRKVIKASRNKGVKIIFLRMSYQPNLVDGGGPESPNYWKEGGLVAMRQNPKWSGKFLTIGSWDWEIVDELKPHQGDIVVNKNRYSGFVNTELDSILRENNIKYLIFIGIATNVCVESTLRDAFFHEYFPVLVDDGCSSVGPDFIQKATTWNVSHVFGWVTTSDDLVKALK